VTKSAKQIERQIERLTKKYVAVRAKADAIAEQMSVLKAEIEALAPEGAETPYGVWQAYSESVRQSYAPTKMQKVVERLVLEGNGEIAQMILAVKTESITSAGMRFITKK
jgi:hypothetical protein